MEERYDGLIANAMVGGRLAVIPTEPRLPGFFYKKGRFDEAGIPYPQPRWTWANSSIATFLTRRDVAGHALQYGLVIQQDWLFVESMIVLNGGSILSQDGTQAVGYLDADPPVEAVQAFVDLFRLHRVAPLHHDPILQPMNFYNDKIGMFGEWTWPVKGTSMKM
jgi:multiple sugar transport system substrate-binding protein